MAQIELYHFWDSFCSFKVRICLEEKGLSWSGHHVDLMAFENLKPDYLAVNSKAVVPTLRYDGTLIPESSIINEFLDDRYPEPGLKPTDALARARMRYWVKVEEEELFTAVRPASLNLMMKQAFAKYSEADLDKLLAAYPRPHLIPTLKKMFLDPPDPKAVAAVAQASRRDICQDGQGADRIRAVAGWRILFARGYRGCAGDRPNPAAQDGRPMGQSSRAQILGRAHDEPASVQAGSAAGAISDAESCCTTGVGVGNGIEIEVESKRSLE